MSSPDSHLALLLATNAPAPYTRSFMEAIRAEGATGRIVARHRPEEIGRRWHVADSETTVATGTGNDLAALARLAWRDRPAHVVLTGSYSTCDDLCRRGLAALLPTRSVHFWGERLRPGSRSTDLLRRLWFGAPGLDGVLAIGSRAVPGYRTLTRPSVPIHVLPYTTDSGLGLRHEPSEQPTIGFAGRLLPYKGLELLLDGLALIRAAVRPHLEVAGSGPDEPRLRRLASGLGLGSTIEWLGDLASDLLAERRRSWWAQAVPSRASEGWGVVVNEALNSGVPVLASGFVNAAADLVRDGVNGLIVPAGETEHPPSWAAAVTAMCEPDGLAERSAAASRTGAAFSPRRAAPWLLDLLRSGDSRDRSFIDETWDQLGD